MATKLPLLARKNIRDEYTAKIPALLEKVKQYTGQDYEFVVDFPTLYPTLDLTQNYQSESPGGIAYNTYEAFVENLERLTDGGDNKDAVEFFNNVVSTRKVDILVTSESPSYSACRVKEGVFQILFKENNYGSNSGSACNDMQKELDKAFGETNKGSLPLAAKKGWTEDFLAKKDKLEASISEELLDNKITLVADPEAIWKLAVAEHDKLKRNEKSQIDLESISRNMGAGIFAYFEGFLSMLQYKFKQDDMMVEAFMDACPSKEIRFTLVPTGGLTKSYNDAIFEDDALVIRTTPQYWYTNCSSACENVEKLL